jgi:glucose-6-phosphate-specific signal transduction histidine kinase
MNPLTRRVLYWTPRILGLVFAGFISLFALDVFDENQGLGPTLVAFLMHMIPTAMVLLVLGLAWRWEWVGGVVFIVLGCLYIATAWGRFHWSAYAVISGPLFLLGALFLANWIERATLRATVQIQPGWHPRSSMDG